MYRRQFTWTVLALIGLAIVSLALMAALKWIGFVPYIIIASIGTVVYVFFPDLYGFAQRRRVKNDE